MNNIKQFNSYQTTFNKLIKQANNDLIKINIAYYHHDYQSEPFLHIEAHIENVHIEETIDYGKIITIHTNEVALSFFEKNYLTNISGDAVVFSSKHDEETYCIIEFC
ncbi:hypothetical protein [Evansella tamaricis]|uniref:Uncharacterized protein n=1 Tax=Evansella tamaricis TaxID=2069301 RepID=A0ABS6JE37_9BACI|nr:hypothetical protein [Evansella tamaricis]MBU9711112.1 hypothetical protein [Evansella tamaricis]